MLDEPLSALDRNLRMETRGELVRLQRRLGTSFILVTHDQEEALTMADRIGVMQNGRLAQVGTPAEVYERPRNRFVAEFLGAANILPAIVRLTNCCCPDLGVTVARRDIGRSRAGAAGAASGTAAYRAHRCAESAGRRGGGTLPTPGRR